jgi:hypothetical protein
MVKRCRTHEAANHAVLADGSHPDIAVGRSGNYGAIVYPGLRQRLIAEACALPRTGS